MTLRRLLVAVTAGALVGAGWSGTAAHADRALPADSTGPLVVWGDADDPVAGPAVSGPGALTTAALDVAVTDRATAVVTADGRLRVWGPSGAAEVAQAPTDITDAVAVTLIDDNGAVLRAGGKITVWGVSAKLRTLPNGTYEAVSLAGTTGYAVARVAPKGLTVWGTTPAFRPPPSGIIGLVDVSAGPDQVLALRANGTVVAWGNAQVSPLFNTVPDLGGQQVVEIATGPGANGVVLADGTIRIWGPSVPVGQPDLTGQRVVSLDLGDGVAGAVTADGAVHTWGSDSAIDAVPASLAGQPISTIAVGAKHAAVLIAYRAVSEVRVSGSPQVGQTLTATPATYTLPPTTTTGQWYADLDPIPGQTGTTLTVTDAFVGRTLSYRSSASRGGLTRRSNWKASAPVGRGATTTTLSLTPARMSAGRAATATATVSRVGGTPAGAVTFTAGTSTRTVILKRGKATWTLPRLAAGTYPVTATYPGSPSSDPSAAGPVNLTITKAASRVRASATRTPKRVRIAVQIRSHKAVSAVGKVTVRLAGRTARAEVDANGRALVTIRRVPRGAYTALVRYAGNSSVSGSKGRVQVRP